MSLVGAKVLFRIEEAEQPQPQAYSSPGQAFRHSGVRQEAHHPSQSRSNRATEAREQGDWVQFAPQNQDPQHRSPYARPAASDSQNRPRASYAVPQQMQCQRPIQATEMQSPQSATVDHQFQGSPEAKTSWTAIDKVGREVDVLISKVCLILFELLFCLAQGLVLTVDEVFTVSLPTSHDLSHVVHV